jgi:hypothetical protein
MRSRAHPPLAVPGPEQRAFRPTQVLLAGAAAPTHCFLLFLINKALHVINVFTLKPSPLIICIMTDATTFSLHKQSTVM